MALKNGEVMNAIEAKRDGESCYVIEGTIQGKKINERMTSENPIYSDAQVEVLLKAKMLSGIEKSLSVFQYIPSIDPLKPMPIEFEYLGDYVIRQTVGFMNVTVGVDEDAVAHTVEYPIGTDIVVYRLVNPDN